MTRGARTAFGVDADGAIEWRLAGPERALLYRLAAETGLSATEIASLTAEAFDLGPDLATVTVGAAYSRRRRRESRPLWQSTAAAMREYLIEHGPDQPAFQLPCRDELDRLVREDLHAAAIDLNGLAEGDVGFSMLRTTFLRALLASRLRRR